MARHGREAITCLILGLFSFATLPASFAIDRFEVELPKAVATALYVAAFVAAIAACVLALVLGRRANKAIRRSGGRIFGDIRATSGMVLGVIGTGLGLLTIPIQIATISTRYSFHPGYYSPVGSLRTINTAAITYSSQYGHGFPLRLSFLAPPKLGRNGRYEDPNDQAAGFIDEILASGTKGRYRFYYVAGPVDSQGKVQSYTVHADPIQPSAEHPYYFTDQTGVIRKQSGREADASSPPVD
jgi:hypothetical protein